MAKLIFTKEKTEDSVGFIGGGVPFFNEAYWPNCPKNNIEQVHLLTLYSNFFKANLISSNQRISVFISLKKHSLGGVIESLTNEYTVNNNQDLELLDNGFSRVIIYQIDDTIPEYNKGNLNIDRCYFEISKNIKKDLEDESLFFEEFGMGKDISKTLSIPFFENDKIRLEPKFQFFMQILEEDIDNKLHIFQHGIGYLYINRNIKKILNGNDVGLFFIQHT